MSYQLRISPRLIPSVASSYTDVNRIFMEYIDNSLDSAEEYFDQSLNLYSKEVKIRLVISNKSIHIVDNCSGISDLAHVVGRIGDSGKRNQPWLNGQFGYGIYSFMAYCSALHIATKTKEETYARKISIPRDKFNHANQEEVHFDEPENFSWQQLSGTEVTLSGFDKAISKQISAVEIKGEIEKHFELLLGRNNLKIEIVDQINNQIHKCEQFDYGLYDGEVYEEFLEKASFSDGRQKAVRSFPATIHMFLKITKSTIINKPPVFVLKGRRIGEIREIKQFKSLHKSDIWGHPNLTGYIDLADYIPPTITRSDFKNSDKTRALFSTIQEHEPAILKLLKDANNVSDEQHYHKLEDFLNRALSKLAKLDSINLRSEILRGSEINLTPGGEESEYAGEGGEQHHRTGPLTGQPSKGAKGGGEEGVADEVGGEDAPSFRSGDSENMPSSDNPYEDSDFKGAEKKKSGFDIKLVEFDPPIDINNGVPKRSQLNGGTIVIFKKHPDFESRVSQFRDGQLKITQRLITYLAGEITVHYKDKLQQRQGQAVYNVEMFENLVEFIYKFEDMIKDLVGKNLSDLMDHDSNGEN